MQKILILLFFLFGLAKVSLAINTPTLISPNDNSTITNSALSWETVSNSNQYRVIVDDEESLTSPYVKNYYATGNKYSPQLEPGKYYWKVATKDSSGNWSDWSNVWTFILTSESISNSSPTSTKSPQPTNKPSEFSISSSLSLRSSESLKVSVNLLLPSNPNTKFYLKGAFKPKDGSNYFGLTKVGNNWIENGQSSSNQLSISTDGNGHFSGELEIKPDLNDSGFTGTNDYILKVGRYSSNGSGPIWSNEHTVHITQDQPNPTPIIKPTVVPTSVPDVEGIATEASEIDISQVTEQTPTLTSITKPSPAKTEVLSQKSFNFIPVVLGFIMIGTASVIFVWKRKMR